MRHSLRTHLLGDADEEDAGSARYSRALLRAPDYLLPEWFFVWGRDSVSNVIKVPCMLAIFVVLTYGFGFYSTLLFAFLADIDLPLAFRVAGAVTSPHAFEIPIILLTVGLGALSLWLAFAMLVNPTAGRSVFPLAGPLFRAAVPPGFDASPRRAILAALYGHFHAVGLQPLAVQELERHLGSSGHRLATELDYLAERGAVALTAEDGAGSGVRLTADGIDFWEQTALGKTQVL